MQQPAWAAEQHRQRKAQCLLCMKAYGTSETHSGWVQYLLARVKTASVAALALSFSPKVMTGLNASGFSNDVNLLRDTTSESIT